MTNPAVFLRTKDARKAAVMGKWNKFFASGQAIRSASYAVLRPTAHGSE